METEKEKMCAGKGYNPMNLRLMYDRFRASRICTKYNRKVFLEFSRRSFKMRRLLNISGNFWIKPPFYCNYGYNVFLGKDVVLHSNCILVDICPIQIGNHTTIGSGTQIITSCYYPTIQRRKRNRAFGKPVTIGSNVWIGGGVVIHPGVRIGRNTVVEAGSVVTEDLPSNVIAKGNPCKVIDVLKEE